MPNAPTIWVVNEAGHDYSPALDVVPGGEIKYLSIGHLNPLFFDRMLDEFAYGVVNRVKEDDYLLSSGTPPANMAVFHLWMLMFHSCKLLLWDAKRRRYKIISMDRAHIQGIVEKHIERG